MAVAAKLRSSFLRRPRALKMMGHSAKKKKQLQQYNTTYWSFGSRWSSPATNSALRSFARRRHCDGFLVWPSIYEIRPGRWSRWDSTTRSDFNSNSLDFSAQSKNVDMKQRRLLSYILTHFGQHRMIFIASHLNKTTFLKSYHGDHQMFYHTDPLKGYHLDWSGNANKEHLWKFVCPTSWSFPRLWVKRLTITKMFLFWENWGIFSTSVSTLLL